MIFTVLNEFQDNPGAVLAFVAAWLVAIITGLAFHEFCHAWSAYQLGDDFAARQGRLTLNPLKHLDPMGSALLLVAGFGWAKPTPVIPSRLKYGPVQGGAIVSAAGPLSNFVIAAIAALPLKAGWVDYVGLSSIGDASAGETIGLFLYFLVGMNILLGIFNLIPIPPLDGFDIIQPILPREVRLALAPMRQWGVGLLMVLFILPLATGGAIDPLGATIRTAYDFVDNIVGPT
jgi:Zn-dependent protease